GGAGPPATRPDHPAEHKGTRARAPKRRQKQRVAAPLEIQRWPRPRSPAGGDDAVDAHCQQGIDMLALAHRVAGGVAQKGRDLRGVERVLDALKDWDAEACVSISREQADGEASQTGEAAGILVRAERSCSATRRTASRVAGRSCPLSF